MLGLFVHVTALILMCLTLTHIFKMLTCHQHFHLFQSTQVRLNSIFPASLTSTPPPQESSTQVQNFGILHALPNLGALFKCLAFTKVTTFTCSFGAFDVNVFMFNMSFCGADVTGPGLVGADPHSNQFSAGPV